MKRNAESNLQAAVAIVKNHMVGIFLIHNDSLASDCNYSLIHHINQLMGHMLQKIPSLLHFLVK